MMTERLQKVVEQVESLPSQTQDELAMAREDALKYLVPFDGDHAPPLAHDAQAAFDRVMREQAADLA